MRKKRSTFRRRHNPTLRHDSDFIWHIDYDPKRRAGYGKILRPLNRGTGAGLQRALAREAARANNT